jgi:hypothetical protein
MRWGAKRGVESPSLTLCMCIGEVIKGCSSAGGWNAFEGGDIFACMQMSSGNAQSLRHPLFWNAVSRKINFCSYSAQQPEISLKIFGSALSIIRDEIISDTSQRRNWGRLDIPSVITPSHLYWRWRPFHAIDLYNPSGANISGLALWKNRSVQLNAPNSKQVTRIALINGPETGFGTALIAMLRTGARESWM